MDGTQADDAFNRPDPKPLLRQLEHAIGGLIASGPASAADANRAGYLSVMLVNWLDPKLKDDPEFQRAAAKWMIGDGEQIG